MCTDWLRLRYENDFTKLISTCDCYACTNYTKAYLQHLRNTNEMLGIILLTMYVDLLFFILKNIFFLVLFLRRFQLFPENSAVAIIDEPIR